ncbi:PKD domain-containing protein [Cellulomonas fimi]|uniref:PKD domain containing protein n=1 Tax=Cellulomonas fimi (strain ATCC 484 / DSM 20113 / JCM 1341 / CCUG 24087 / LMG 16345 / NBRC 15513 / NCIMB 8980 / NCTC 7547 / NRS-133) TaxID=590998 RepID=F4GZ40_CELFA|nr:PKD domain-containing protein [Cellulomonas fimi]AEE47156.1 PKD domain containing protein [Cellulomonas fimi ATCC 484]NNH07707.1 PKD domain-containing protein [Cellulomonas fimi]VEH35432.1 Protease 1 precursor [Cellulomonas fimi]
MSLRPVADRSPVARTWAVLTSVALVAVGLVAGSAPAQADTAPPAGLPPTVAADALPTVQIDGVVWQQALSGNLVYAGGEFSNARPAGNAAGVGNVPRANLLRFDVRTGVLDPSWAPNPNGQVRAVVKSPDGSRIYVGGSFTSISGVARYRIAAFDAVTGALITTFNAGANGQVRALAATNTTVYAGGIFTQAGSSSRTRLAAFNASNGALLPWNPTVDDGSVSALTVAPDGGTVIVGGNFTSFNGSTAAPDGLARVDAVTGAALPFPATSQIRNGGTNGSILGLTGDADNMYGVGYTWGRSGGTLEGVFAADWATGSIRWIADCHGDSYAVHAQGPVVYAASHHHYCGNVGGTPQNDEWLFYRADAYTKEPMRKLGREHLGYTNFEGTAAPEMLNFYPDLDTGTFTGQNQGPWAVTGDDRYIVYGGEFLNVNFRRQQGLVRFAIPSIAPNDQGPRFSGADFTPTARAIGAGTVRISWTANADFDNEDLTYTVLRNGQPLPAQVKKSQIWMRPTQGVTDTGLTAGQTYTYAVRVSDPFGNTVTSPSVTATANGSGAVSAYAQTVMADGASHLWRLGESSGTTALDTAGTDDGSTGTALTRGTPGAIAGDSSSATTFAGTTNSRVVAPQREQNLNELSVEAWIRTTSNQGGWVVGFGNSTSLTGTSTSRDRQLYVDSAGRVQFGASPGQNRTVRSPGAVNDGQWHHVVGTMGATGMALYVDGALVASRADNPSGRNFTGFWRIGGDSLSGWPNTPASNNFNGAIDEVAVYPFPLSAGTIAAHHTLGRTGDAPEQPPVAAFTTATDGLKVTVDGTGSTDPDGTVASYAWAFGDGATGTGPTASRTYAAAGTYTVTLTVTDDDGNTAQTSHDVTVTAPPPNQPPVASFTAATTGLTVQVDAGASSDPDGTVTQRSWSFGDGGTATGTTASHTYAADGTYTVTLTVTDDDGATAQTTRAVTVTTPPADAPFAADAFARTVSGGWGTADTGGAWSVAGGATNFSVASGVGAMRVTGAGFRLSGFLPVSSTSADVRVDVALDAMPTGGGTDLEVAGRTVGTTDGYRARLKMLSTGVVRASIVGISAGTTTTVAQVNVPGLTYTAGQTLSVRFQADGTGTTALRLKVWPAGTPEPAAWTLTGSSTTAALQVAGGVGLSVYTSSTTTTLPLTARWSQLTARPVPA